MGGQLNPPNAPAYCEHWGATEPAREHDMTDKTQQARAAVTPEAIEAAAKVLRARFNGQREDKPWSSGDQMRIYVGDARAALDAAAPYMESSDG